MHIAPLLFYPVTICSFSLWKENFFSIYSSTILCPTPTTDPHAFSLLFQWFYAYFKFFYLFPFIASYWLFLALSYHTHSLSLRFNSSCYWIPPFISVSISPHPNLPPFPIQHMVLLSLHSLWVLSACSAPEDILQLTEILLFHLTLPPLSSYTLQHQVGQTMCLENCLLQIWILWFPTETIQIVLYLWVTYVESRWILCWDLPSSSKGRVSVSSVQHLPITKFPM